MSFPFSVEIHPGELAPELRTAACGEILSLWYEDRIDDFDVAGFNVVEHIPDNPEHAAFFGVGCYNSTTESYDPNVIASRISWMHTEFPALFETLQQLCDLPTTLGEPVSVFPTSFTVNYYQPGQVTDRHQDMGNMEFDRIARVANILGRGSTYFASEYGGEYVPFDTEEGDVISFPNHRRARPWHFGEGNDDKMRISVGLQLRGSLKV